MRHLLLLSILFAGCINLAARNREMRAQQVQRMCSDANYAYETGYNEGLERNRLDTSWVDMSCVQDVREQVRQSYQAGFDKGMQNAPIIVKGVGGGGGQYVSSAQTCRFSSDCYDGQSCRADVNGTNVCMGGGYAGDPCWFSSDCVSDSCNGSTKTCK